MPKDKPTPPDTLREVLRRGRDVAKPPEGGGDEARRVVEAERRAKEAEGALVAAQQRLARLERRLAESEQRADRLAKENEDLKAQAAHGGLEFTRLERELTRKDVEHGVDDATVQFLLRRLKHCHAELAKSDDAKQIAMFDEAIRQLTRELDRKNHQVFARKSERTRPPKTARPPKKRTTFGPTPQPDLEQEEQLFLLDAPDQICPCCGAPLVAWAGQTEDSERIIVVERKFTLIVDKRQKYVCSGGCPDVIDTALGADKVIAGGRYDVGFVAMVAADKYDASDPLNGQAERMGREGLRVTSQTLFRQLHHGGLLLHPTWRAVLADLLADADLVHMDETRWRLMKPGVTKGWWMWTVATSAAVFFEILPTRAGEVVAHLLSGWSGSVVCDAAGPYKRAARLGGRQITEASAEQMAGFAPAGLSWDVNAPATWPELVLIYCWMHARRELFHAVKDFPEAEAGLHLVNRLFTIEAEVSNAEVEHEDARRTLRERRRDTDAREVICALERWMNVQTPVPGTQLQKAIGYLRNQWVGLTRFLDDADLPLDNGQAERDIRKPVLGRKNHQGSRSETGVWVAALYYTLCGTCRRLGLDSRAYLHEAMVRAIRNPGTVFLPREYKAELEMAKLRAAA